MPKPAQSLMKLAGLLAALFVTARAGAADPQSWQQEWPTTAFTRHTVALSDIRSGGPSKDGIPAIDSPRFEALDAGRASGWARNIADNEPVISVASGDIARAYPVRILIWHEIVNDFVGSIPVIVTYCPLCNSGLVFDRSRPDRILDFGTTGKLRNSDLVMTLAIMATIHTLDTTASGRRPFLYDGSMPEGIDPMERVVAVETAPGHYKAWSPELLSREGRIQSDDLFLTWEAGQASALDSRTLSAGRDIGGVVVQRRINGILVDVPYNVPFAFAFHAFRGGGPIHGAKRTAAPH